MFSYVDFDSYVNQAYYVIKSNRINLKYLTALLNSKIITFWLKYKGKMQGDNFQIDKEPLLNLPILNIDNNHISMDNINNLIDKIILISRLNSTDSTEEIVKLENNLNKIFYELYNLNDDDIEKIDGIY